MFLQCAYHSSQSMGCAGIQKDARRGAAVCVPGRRPVAAYHMRKHGFEGVR